MIKRMSKFTALLLSALMILSVIATGLTSAVAAEVSIEEGLGASSGTTGDCTWTLDNEGVLTISGEGYMDGAYNHGNPNNVTAQ